MATISLCMIVKNEEGNLPKSLAPIAAYFDEVILVDTGSTDRTRDLAGNYGAKVFEIPWRDDFAGARNESIARASGDWIFWFDADNRIAVEDARKMRRFIESPRDRIFWCTEVVEPKGERLIQKRIFPRLPGFNFIGRIHEQLSHPAEGIRYVMTDIRIYHWGYVDKELLKAKGMRNLRILQEVLDQNPEDYFAHFNMARCYENFREFGKAMTHLQEVMKCPAAARENPEIHSYAFLLAFMLLEKMGRMEEGKEILSVLLAQNPAFGLGWFYLGKYAFKTGNIPEAIVHLERFHKFGINIHSLDLPRERVFFESYYWLAQGYEKMEEIALARRAYESALVYDPQNSHVFLKLALLCKRQGQVEDEDGFWRRCLELHPGNQVARNALGMSR